MTLIKSLLNPRTIIFIAIASISLILAISNVFKSQVFKIIALIIAIISIVIASLFVRF